MKTPKEYIKNLNNNIITIDMLDACLWSVNKRAKNYRDMRRHRLYNARENGMAKFYNLKEELLKYVKPVCIHHETYWREDYYNYNLQKIQKYYLYYELPNHSYHSPIDASHISKYPELEVIDLKENIITKGHDIDDLISVQFVQKVLQKLKSGVEVIQPTQVTLP